MKSFKKLMSDYGLGVIIILLLLAFAISTFADYVTTKVGGGSEAHTPLAQMASTYADSPSMDVTESMAPQESEPSAPKLSGQSGPVQDPVDLLPADANSEFSELAPSSNVANNTGMLEAGFHYGGADQPMRNANLQIRKEEPNPQQNVGPWQQSTIEADPYKMGI